MRVRIRGLSKQYGNVQALESINLDIDSKCFTTLLGPSGCGKTTLLRCIAGLEIPDSGEIYFNDRCVFSADNNINITPQKRNLGMVFQEFALWPHMNVSRNIGFSLDARGMKDARDEKIRTALQMVRLEGMDRRLPSQLSGGQQQRVAFARAIVANPSVVLFDEPLSALDALLRDQMRAELSMLVKTMGLTAIYVTHDQTEAMSMSDVIIVMNQGTIIQEGTPEKIYENPGNQFVMDFVGKMNWFPQETECIRPEQVCLVKQGDNCRRLQAVVKGSAFLGDRYEIYLLPEGGELQDPWTIYHSERIEAGREVSLFLPEDKILKTEKKKLKTVVLQ